MKPFRSSINFFAAALLVAAFSVAASAQVATLEGRVMLKQADGTVVPLQGATLSIHRTDIKQDLGSVKTDKNGKYVRVGVPFVGTFTLLVSGPGASPDFLVGMRASRNPANDFTLSPGDGRVLTLAEATAASANGRPTAAAGGAPAPSTADVENSKKKAAEMAAERAKIEAENAKAQELNTKLPEILKAGNDAFNAKNYEDAIARYNEGITADPQQVVFPRNKSVALRTRAIEKYNASVKSKDQAAKEAARNDLKDAVDSVEKAVSNYREFSSKRAGASAPGAGGTQQSEELGLLEIRAETYRLALQTSSPIDSNNAAKAIEEYLNLENDSNKKNKMEASLGDALFFAGKVDESIAKFREIMAKSPSNLDAIFGLGISLAAKSAEDPTMIAEAKKTLEQFVSKAPDGYPRKAEAAEAAVYLGESLKSEAASKAQQEKKGGNTRRRP